eukprot:1143536-Pelagomonas_calceolata.AAC.4
MPSGTSLVVPRRQSATQHQLAGTSGRESHLPMRDCFQEGGQPSALLLHSPPAHWDLWEGAEPPNYRVGSPVLPPSIPLFSFASKPHAPAPPQYELLWHPVASAMLTLTRPRGLGPLFFPALMHGMVLLKSYVGVPVQTASPVTDCPPHQGLCFDSADRLTCPACV